MTVQAEERTGTSRNGTDPSWPVVTFDEAGKMTLPDVPSASDTAAQCRWLTSVFFLGRAHPIIAGELQGSRGPEGQIALRRAGKAPDLRFEPAKAINTPMRLIESFTGRRYAGDGMVPAFKAEHCRQISYVIGCLCDTSGARTEAQEAAGVVNALLGAALAVQDRTTYGTGAQRYEAAIALQRDIDHGTGRPIGPMVYLIDANTGELVIRVGDLQLMARQHLGSSLPRGFLDGRMQAFGWTRIELSGYSLPGRDGRRVGVHARCDAYRGFLPADPEEEGSVNM